MMREPRLGIDIGRVIISGDGVDTNFLGTDDSGALRAPEMDGAFSAVTELVRSFQGRVWLVSKAGPRIQKRTWQWLDAHDFFGRTGLSRLLVRFCRQREEKAIHARALDLTHFIDDREDVLRALSGIVDYRFLFGPQRHQVPIEKGLVQVLTWNDVLDPLRGIRESAGAPRE
jgi:hypothetical protein